MCNPFSPSCIATSVATTALTGLANGVGEAAATAIGHAMTWWISTPSVDPNSAAVRQLQAYTFPLTAAMLVGSAMVQSARMAISRKKDPLLNIAFGLLRYVAVTSVGLIALAAALRAGDELAAALVTQGIGDYAERMKTIFAVNVALGPITLSGVGVIMFLLALVQWVLGLFRQAGILVLAALIPIAASGSMSDSTKPWLGKAMVWLLTLVAYKPMAAMIYTIGFTLMGSGQDFTTLMTGGMVMLLAVIALPAMLRFFSWSGAGNSGAGVGGVMAAGAVGAIALAGMRGGGASGAVRSAQAMSATGPGSGPGGAAAASPSPSPPPTTPGGGPSSPGATGAAPVASGSGAARTAPAGAGPASAAAAAGGAPTSGAATSTAGAATNTPASGGVAAAAGGAAAAAGPAVAAAQLAHAAVRGAANQVSGSGPGAQP